MLAARSDTRNKSTIQAESKPPGDCPSREAIHEILYLPCIRICLILHNVRPGSYTIPCLICLLRNTSDSTIHATQQFLVEPHRQATVHTLYMRQPTKIVHTYKRHIRCVVPKGHISYASLTLPSQPLTALQLQKDDGTSRLAQSELGFPVPRGELTASFCILCCRGTCHAAGAVKVSFCAACGAPISFLRGSRQESEKRHSLRLLETSVYSYMYEGYMCVQEMQSCCVEKLPCFLNDMHSKNC